MKLTVICRGTDWQIDQLKKASLRNGIDVEVRDLLQAEPIPEDLGEIVLWRSSSLGKGEARLNTMRAILKDRIVINRTLANLPKAAEKYFQQEHTKENATTVRGIPTFQFVSKQEIFKAINEKILHYPFIVKPNCGSKGEGVFKINNDEDVDRIAVPVGGLVFQNFIKNSGDYRALILGGRLLGVVKRTAKKGHFLNNISKGGSAEVVIDEKIIEKIRHISTTIASIFELTLCGVDVIYDEEQKEFLFLEVNTAPQWRGFQMATGINVADQILSFCKRQIQRRDQPLEQIVYNEYLSQERFLGDKQFHFFSRLYLWTKNDFYRTKLEGLKKGYIGESQKEHQIILSQLFLQKPVHGEKMIAKEAREKILKKYPFLDTYRAILFKYLFSKTLYGIDLRSYVKDIVQDGELISLKDNIEGDENAMRVLSTHAVNYAYLVGEYIGEKACSVDLKKYFQIGLSYRKENDLDLQIYFFTHCIIGASRFYSKQIEEPDKRVYTEMLLVLQDIIHKNFLEISLDNKFEFLVCARMCGFQTNIEDDILKEATASLSPDGNFIIDRCNKKASLDARNDLSGSEHRNVLYIMSTTPYHAGESWITQTDLKEL